MRSTKRSCRNTLALASAFLITACQGGSGTPVNTVPPQSTAIRIAPASIASIDGRNKCRFGKIHVFNGPGGTGGAIQIVADRSGNLWYGSIGINSIVKYESGHGGTAYPIPAANAKPEGIAFDSHRHLWFTEWNLPDIARFKRGKFKRYVVAALHGSQSQATDMIRGPDERIWFTTDNYGIGAHSLRGKTTMYSIQNNAEQPEKLAIGPDKNLWFNEFAGSYVGKITTRGVVTEYNVGGGGNNYGIAAGSDGRIWFTDSGNHRIGAMKTDGSGLVYYPVGTGSPAEIALRSQDGKLYFTEWEGYIGQISTTGVVRLCAIKASPTFVAFGITENPVDHSMWFVDNSDLKNRIGELVVR